MIRFNSQLHFLHVLNDAKPKARRSLLASASDELITAIAECAFNRLNRNHKLTKEEKKKFQKYKLALK